jgi:hypothetical protein
VNKRIEPSWSVLTEPGRYSPAIKHTGRGLPEFRERLRTADYFPRESDGQDGDAQQQEEQQ